MKFKVTMKDPDTLPDAITGELSKMAMKYVRKFKPLRMNEGVNK